MQTPTHILTGIVLQRALKPIRSRRVRQTVVVVVALLSHAVLDRLGRFAYHPAEALIHDPFWVAYHVGLFLLTVVLLRRFWSAHVLGIVAANLPDVDWVILHPAHLLGVEIPFWPRAQLHRFVDFFVASLPPFPWLAELPSRHLDPLSALIEVGFLAGLGDTLWAMRPLRTGDSDEVPGSTLGPKDPQEQGTGGQ